MFMLSTDEAVQKKKKSKSPAEPQVPGFLGQGPHVASRWHPGAPILSRSWPGLGTAASSNTAGHTCDTPLSQTASQDARAATQ